MKSTALHDIGQRYSRLVVLGETTALLTPCGVIQRRIIARCDCGHVGPFRIRALRSGNTKSCGCFMRERTAERSRTHGGAPREGCSAEYRSWRAMKARCLNPATLAYPNYGGRGIKVCERWLQFGNFLADMGCKPSPAHTMDRVDNDGNYEPGNVRWATRSEQNSNRRGWSKKKTVA